MVPEVIAYTIGSFWYCIAHGENSLDATAVYEGNTFDCYTYRCDDCGKLIAEAVES